MSKEIYVDTYGRSHVAFKPLSSGGQGIVYLTEEPNVLLKLEWDPLTQKIETDVKQNKKFDSIKILPLLKNTNLTLPQTILKDAVGYTMKMLDGMVSFDDAFSGDHYELPDNEWLNEMNQKNPDVCIVLQKYIATGGIRKRLNSFLKASCILAKIHASGLVYCDISGKNMFVSSDPDLSQVWLIDCDNLNFMKNTLKIRDGGLHSPGYGAPEIYADKGKSMYSDAFSFAIALFWELTKQHPFVGEAVLEALEDMDIIESPEEDYACMENFPWINDIEDDSNRSNSGLPIDMLVSPSLHEKFSKTFSEIGRNNRVKRTTMPEWSYILSKELDDVVRCKRCGMDFYYATEQCPWCDYENSILKIVSYKLENTEEKEFWQFVKEISEDVIDIPLRVLEGFNSDNLDEYAFQIRVKDKGIEVGNLSTNYDFFVNKTIDNQIYGTAKFNTLDKIYLSAIHKDTRNHYVVKIEAIK